DAAAPCRAEGGGEERLERGQLERGLAPLDEVAGGGALQRREDLIGAAEPGQADGVQPRRLEVAGVGGERLTAGGDHVGPVTALLGAAGEPERGLTGALAPAVGGEIGEAERGGVEREPGVERGGVPGLGRGRRRGPIAARRGHGDDEDDPARPHVPAAYHGAGRIANHGRAGGGFAARRAGDSRVYPPPSGLPTRRHPVMNPRPVSLGPVPWRCVAGLAILAGCQGKSEPDPPRPPPAVIEARLGGTTVAHIIAGHPCRAEVDGDELLVGTQPLVAQVGNSRWSGDDGDGGTTLRKDGASIVRIRDAEDAAIEVLDPRGAA